MCFAGFAPSFHRVARGRGSRDFVGHGRTGRRNRRPRRLRRGTQADTPVVSSAPLTPLLPPARARARYIDTRLRGFSCLNPKPPFLHPLFPRPPLRRSPPGVEDPRMSGMRRKSRFARARRPREAQRRRFHWQQRHRDLWETAREVGHVPHTYIYIRRHTRFVDRRRRRRRR